MSVGARVRMCVFLYGASRIATNPIVALFCYFEARYWRHVSNHAVHPKYTRAVLKQQILSPRHVLAV